MTLRGREARHFAARLREQGTRASPDWQLREIVGKELIGSSSTFHHRSSRNVLCNALPCATTARS